MASFFKTFFLGMLITILLPFIAALFALFFVYCLIVFIYTAIRSIIVYFSGGRPFGDLPEDVKAKEIIAKRLADSATPPQTQPQGNNIVINNPQINYVAKDGNVNPMGLNQSAVPPSIDVKPIENAIEQNTDLIEEKDENQ